MSTAAHTESGCNLVDEMAIILRERVGEMHHKTAVITHAPWWAAAPSMQVPALDQ